MADKKITALTALTTPSQDDLLVIVDDPSGTPITKKITMANLLGNVSVITSSSDPELNTIKAALTANANTTGASSILAAGKFVVNALSTSQNTSYQYGVFASSMLGQSAANVKVEHAAGKFLLDVSNATGLIVNTYGVLVSVANTGTRAAQPQAFIGIAESTTSASYSTKYLLDIGQNGAANVTADLVTATGNVTPVLSRTAASATNKLRIRVNGADYFILLANSSASSL